MSSLEKRSDDCLGDLSPKRLKLMYESPEFSNEKGIDFENSIPSPIPSDGKDSEDWE